MEEAGVKTELARSRADELRREARRSLFLAHDGELAALLAVADPIKTTTPEAIAALHAEDSGRHADRRQSCHAEAVARQLHIDEVRADVLPAEKRAVVQSSSATVASSPWPATRQRCARARGSGSGDRDGNRD